MSLNFPFKFLFSLSLFLGTLISLSSSNWMGIWMGLELNLMSFIPLVMSMSSISEVESGVKYFIVQSVGSGFLLLGGLFFFIDSFSFSGLSFDLLFFVFAFFGLMMKLGIFPFHFWIPSVMGGLNWTGCFILATWQKLAPLMLLFWFSFSSFFLLVCFFSFMSSIVGGIGGIGQIHIRLLMAYSSINHLGWMMISSYFSFFILTFYFLVYCLISVSIFSIVSYLGINSLYSGFYFMNNFHLCTILFFILLSLGGVPPFTGFFSKVLVLMELMVFSENFLLCLLFILGSLFSLYFYLGFFFSLYLKIFLDSWDCVVPLLFLNNGYHWGRMKVMKMNPWAGQFYFLYFYSIFVSLMGGFFVEILFLMK